MAEIETLTVDEPLAERIERHNFDRLLMLSDGVFAIAITLLVLELRPPEHWDGQLATLLQVMWRPLFAYSAGFMIIGGFWGMHRIMFAKLRRVDRIATCLALLLLFLVAVVPAMAALIGAQGPAKSMPVCFLLIAAISVVQLALWTYAALIADLADASLDRHDRIAQAIRFALPLLIFGSMAAANLSGAAIVSPLTLAMVAAAIVVGRLLLWRQRQARKKAA